MVLPGWGGKFSDKLKERSMKLKLILLSIILSLFLVGVGWGATYYLRGDGSVTAANKANATSCSAAASAMNITQHNAATFAAGDTITICDTGGIFRDGILTPPTSGTTGAGIITYNASGTPIITGADAPTGFATANATVTKTWSTWTNAVAGENLADAANTSKIAYARDATDGAAKFTSTDTSLSDTSEYGIQSATGDTWVTWGVPAGSTVSKARVNSAKKKVVDNTGMTVNHWGVCIIDNAGTALMASTNMLDSQTLATTTDADYVALGANADINVNAGSQAAATAVRLRLKGNYTVSGATSIDVRFDDIAITMTYNSPTIWDKAVTTQPYLVKVGATAPKPMSASREALAAAGDWYWAANVLSVYAAADPSGTVEVGTRDQTIQTNNKIYLTFDGLTLRHGNEKAAGVNVGSTTVTGIIFQNCIVEENAKRGFDLKGSSAADSITINSCIVRNNGGWGIYVSNAYTAGTISNCTIYGNGWYSAADAQQYGGIQGLLGNFNIYGNTIYDNVMGVASSTYESHGIYALVTTAVANIYNNLVYGHPNGHGIKVIGSANVYRNAIYNNNGNGLLLGGNGATNVVYQVYDNLIYGNNILDASGGLKEASKGAGTLSLSIYNNTVYKNSATTQQELKIEDDLTVLNVKNNIFYTTDTRRTASVVAQTGTVAIDNNLHWRADGDPAIYYAGGAHTWAEWQGHGYDTVGVNADPLFVSASDFHLQPGSPAINAGVDVGLITDYAGRPIQLASDIGAYETETRRKRVN